MRLILVLVTFSILLSASFYSCRKMPNDGIPFYIKIDSVQVSTLPDEGLNTHNISDVWVEALQFNLGAYEIPTRFPVLLKDEVRFVISPGVQQNGVSNNRIIYPMMNVDTFTISARLDTVYNITPTFTYRQGVDFKVLQDFDFGNEFNKMVLVNDSGYGISCGAINVLSTDSNVEASHQKSFMAEVGDQVWIEIDYKCDIPFYVGFYARYSNGLDRVPLVFVNARPQWNKMYINVSEAVSFYMADVGYSLYFEALKPFGNTGGTVYIDNIKVLVLK